MIDTEKPAIESCDIPGCVNRATVGILCSTHAVLTQRIDELTALHALLDAHGIDRANRAEGNASRVYTLSERVQCVLRERDRAVQAEELARVACKNAVERAKKLAEHMDNIVGVM